MTELFDLVMALSPFVFAYTLGWVTADLRRSIKDQDEQETVI